MKKQKVSRGQQNKNVRRVLLQHQIDLNQLVFRTSARTIYLSGVLLRNTGSDLNAQHILRLIEDLEIIGIIQSDLSNWRISKDSISFVGDYEYNAEESVA